jgi:hypothetical protein
MNTEGLITVLIAVQSRGLVTLLNWDRRFRMPRIFDGSSCGPKRQAGSLSYTGFRRLRARRGLSVLFAFDWLRF